MRGLRGVVAAVVAAVLALAAVGKLLSWGQATQSVEALTWVPRGLVLPVTVLLLATELTTATLLVWPRFRTLGAIGGAVLSGIFSVVTATKLLMGTPTTCACFGVFLALAPHDGLRLDLALLVCCLTLLAWPEGAGRTDATAEAPGGTAASGALRHAPALACYACLVLLLLRAGDARLEAGKQASLKGPREQVLKYDEVAPPFQLTSTTGQRVSPESLRGKWTLLIFANPHCSSCEVTLADLAPHVAAWQARLNLVILVRTGNGAWAEGSVRDYAARHLQFPLFVPDPDSRVGRRYVDRPAHWPFAVLLNAESRVAGVFDGYRGGQQVLSRQLDGLLSDQPVDVTGLREGGQWLHRRLPDVTVQVAGQPRRLADLTGQGTVFVSFLNPTSSASTSHRRVLERYGREQGIRSVLIYPAGADLQALARQVPPTCVLALDTERLRERLGLMPPATFVVQNGRLVYQTGNRSGSDALRRVLSTNAKERHP